MALQLLTTGLGTCPFSSSSAPSRLSYSSPTLAAASFGISSLATSSLSVSVSVSAPSTPLPVICGRGDKKTKRGKRFKHSYGNARPRNKSKGTGPPRAPTPPNPYKKKFSEFEYSDIGELEPVPDFDDE